MSNTLADTSSAGSLSHPPVTSVAIVGFGTMGSGIAQVCARAGLSVHVIEPSQSVIDRDMKQIDSYLQYAVTKSRMTEEEREAVMARITPGKLLDAAFGADIVIEAAPERIELKSEIFRTLDANTPKATILASNTSALSITEIAAAAELYPERVCGLHFFNPAPVLPLVEVISAERTSPETAARALAFVQQIGKEPISCDDTPGFVVNRILIPLLNDVVRVHEAGTASAEDIDKGCRYGLNWPIGPLALIDLIGLDVHVHASEALFQSFRESRMSPPPSIVRMVKAGKLGRKNGEGFFRYEK